MAEAAGAESVNAMMCETPPTLRVTAMARAARAKSSPAGIEISLLKRRSRRSGRRSSMRRVPEWRLTRGAKPP